MMFANGEGRLLSPPVEVRDGYPGMKPFKIESES